ncbi:unnamed protein product [Protopolystoma xenopodis]|uniref:Uncharacterized protein n=1 Tax=Protopolystoma xenopodis TaxID=117903 RepID=A0A448WZM6_9PLAT|nr:unnamed protein product [Protopolystoma xenopodis]
MSYLVSAICTELTAWNSTWKMDHWNEELAVPFSYWLIQNLPISCAMKARLLNLDHVVQRLRALLSIIKQVLVRG